MNQAAKYFSVGSTNGAGTMVSSEILERTHLIERAAYSPPAIGAGVCIGQYGEILQGQLEDRNFQKRRFLLSLRCNVLYSTATFIPSDEGGLEIEPAHKNKARRVAEITLSRFGLETLGGRLTIESNIDEAKGCGSSTADCAAASLAILDSIGQVLSEEDLARIVVEAEIASDNVMFKQSVLFAHREGVVLEKFGAELPKIEVLGFDTEVDGAVNTLDFPPAVYTWRQIQCFHALVAGLRRGFRDQDIAVIGQVAMASAAINQEFLPKPMFPEIRAIARAANALGVAVAHSGTVASILLNPHDHQLETKVNRIRHDLGTLDIKEIIRFQT
ncbi:MAG TPA: hypothetical protein VJW20_19385 [Candidatus Angelobacter sp.]|nr:hypothetical protein [Candidatus Angelobacter sp.]